MILLIVFLVFAIIGGTFIVFVEHNDEPFKKVPGNMFIGIFMIWFGGFVLGASVASNEKNKALTHAEAYKKAIYYNPYEAKILYELQEDSSLVPMDTIYQLKK